MVTTDHPDLVKAVVLAAAEASRVPEDVGKAPFIASDAALPEEQRLAALRQALFAPGHDPSVWLSGWYPATIKMQRAAAQKTGTRESWPAAMSRCCRSSAIATLLARNHTGMRCRNSLDCVVLSILTDASHTLFPEQPAAFGEAVLPWIAQFKA